MGEIRNILCLVKLYNSNSSSVLVTINKPLETRVVGILSLHHEDAPENTISPSTFLNSTDAKPLFKLSVLVSFFHVKIYSRIFFRSRLASNIDMVGVYKSLSMLTETSNMLSSSNLNKAVLEK